MKKFLLFWVALALCACGASKLEIQEASLDCDVLVELRYVPDDSVALMVGNQLFMNTSQMFGREMFPLLVSARDPMDLERPASVQAIPSAEDFAAYLQRAVPGASRFGIVISSNVKQQIGFDEAEAVSKIRNALSSVQGGSAVLFHEEGGKLTDMKKLY